MNNHVGEKQDPKCLQVVISHKCADMGTESMNSTVKGKAPG